MTNRRTLLRGLGLTVAAAAVPRLGVAQTSGSPPAARFFRIATGGAGGTYFPVGRVMASMISSPPGAPPCDRGGSCGVPGLIAIAQASQGSIENVRLLDERRVESALCQADVAHWASTATGPFAGKPRIEGLRAITGLYREAVHIVVRQDSRIAIIENLKGRRVSLGEPASGTLADARLILAAHGVRERDLQPQFLRTGAAADALRDGRIDAFFLVGGFPLPAVQELADRTRIALLPIVGPPADRLRRSSPFFLETIIPTGTYAQVQAVPTMSVAALWLVGAHLPDVLVNGVTRALWNPANRKLLDAGHPEARNINLATALEGLTVPLHPGAAAYYTEIGVQP